MKKSLVARGITGIVASLLGVSAVGCGAATDQEAAEIGSTAEALSVGSVLSNNLATGLKFPAQCGLIDPVSGAEYLVLLGGELSNGTVTDQIIRRTTSGTWAQVKDAGGTDKKLASARSHLAFVQHPTDTSKCIVAGGELANGNAVKDVELISVSNDHWTVTASTMQIERSRFGLELCGDGLIAVGGYDNSKTPTASKFLSSMESSNGLPGVFATAANSLVQPRSDFAFAKNAGSNHYVAAGGFDGSNPTNRVEVISNTISNSRCVPTSVRLGNTSTGTLSASVYGNVGFPEGTANTIAITAGTLGAGTENDLIDLVSVNTTTPSSSTVTQSSGTANVDKLADAVYKPTLVKLSSGFMMIGGGHGAITHSTDDAATAGAKVQKYVPGTVSSANLVTARLGAGAAFLPTAAHAYAAAGQSAWGPDTFVLTTEDITP